MPRPCWYDVTFRSAAFLCTALHCFANMDNRQQQVSDNLISPDNNEQPAVAVFDRVFNALQRARRELMATTSSSGNVTDVTNLLTATRTLFRRRRNQAQGKQFSECMGIFFKLTSYMQF